LRRGGRRTAAMALGVLLVGAAAAPAHAATEGWALRAPEVVLAGVPCELQVEGPADGFPVVLVWPAGRDTLAAAGAVAGVRLESGQVARLFTLAGQSVATASPRVLPGLLAVVPPVLAILLALLTRQVLVSLVIGGWFGCLVLVGWQPLAALLRLGDRFLVEALATPDHASIVLFTTILGGMVGVMARGGLTEGLVQALVRRVRTRRGGQLTTTAMGTAIFFDDYANTLLVGTTMRPLTDRLRISREKLAYLVDSTAAPIATLAVISTWVGFEVGLIQNALAARGEDPGTAYTFFLRSLPYSFYPWLTLLCVYLVAATGRDLGPMRQAEQRALATGQVLRPGARPASETLGADRPAGEAPPPALPPLLGLLPIVTVIATTAFGLVLGGREAAREAGLMDIGLRETLDHANSFAVLMWAAVSFATGTSWGTMGILMPLVFPLGAVLPLAEGLPAATGVGIHLAAVSAVLAGAVFGDHCSPISDTTIMSSLACGSDHIDHVRTQLPYALLVGAAALACGYLPVGWGLPPWLGLLAGAGVVVACLLALARRPVAAASGKTP
jgi:Na+/H+ antiporter NhaC